MVAEPLHHGGVFTAPWWSFYGTTVEWEHHRGVFPDFTMVEKILHHGVFFQKCVGAKSPWWRILCPEKLCFFRSSVFEGWHMQWGHKAQMHRGRWLLDKLQDLQFRKSAAE